MPYRRYGVYYTPEPGPLADFGAAWLGWDMVKGIALPPPEIAGMPAPIADLTAKPRKYGFHGTIKPPFFLARDYTEDGLATALANLCQTLPALNLDQLALARLGRFLALRIDGDQAPLAAMAGVILQQLDHFRAPASDVELARRQNSNLSPRQLNLLATWGYPYVMDQFRFHITLTGPLSSDQARQTANALQGPLATHLPDRFIVASLTLVGEDAAGMFHQIERYPLTG